MMVVIMLLMMTIMVAADFILSVFLAFTHVRIHGVSPWCLECCFLKSIEDYEVVSKHNLLNTMWVFLKTLYIRNEENVTDLHRLF